MKITRFVFVTVLVIIVFISGFINGYIQKHQIEVYDAAAVKESIIKQFPDSYVTSGFKNTEKAVVISKNHLIHLAKKELTKEEADYYKYPHIYYYKVDDVYEVLFDTIKRKPDVLYCTADIPCVYIDKNGVTVLKMKGTEWWNR